jgi:hypothetical protein
MRARRLSEAQHNDNQPAFRRPEICGVDTLHAKIGDLPEPTTFEADQSPRGTGID